MDNLTCDDYHCEGGVDHSHIGIQPHLRRIIAHGKLIDGATGREPVKEAVDNEESTQ